MHIILAEIIGNSGGIINSLLEILGVGICVAIIWGLGWWVITKFNKLPGLVMTIWNGIFIFVGAIVLINFIMSLVRGHGFITY